MNRNDTLINLQSVHSECFSYKRRLRWLNAYGLFSITIRKFIFAVIFFCFTTLYIYVHYADYNGKIETFHYTQKGHFVRHYIGGSYHKECPKPGKGILEKEQQIFKFIRQEHIKLVKDLAEKKAKLQTVLLELSQKESELRELHLHVEQLQILQQELNDRRNVKLSLPNKPLLFDDRSEIRLFGVTDVTAFDRLEQSIDYRRCSISALFRFYLYQPSVPFVLPSTDSLFYELSTNTFLTTNHNEACVFVALFEFNVNTNVTNSLKYWNGVGRNHLILLNKPFENIRTSTLGASMIVTSNFETGSYRSGMDISLNLNVPAYNLMHYERLPQLLPYARQHLLIFLSQNTGIFEAEMSNLKTIMSSAVSSGDSIFFDLNCAVNSENNTGRMALCYDEKRRVAMTRRAHFALIFANCSSVQTRFYEALLAGTVPVLVFANDISLPFEDFVDWRLAALKIVALRLPEIHFILRTITVVDLLEMRRKGRFFLENYLQNTRVLTRTIITTVRYRLQMFASGTPNTDSSILDVASTFLPLATRPPYDDEYLGPMETSIPSFSFTHNTTALQMYSYKIWNVSPQHVEYTPEFLEFESLLPSEAEFDTDTSFAMRPIRPGSGQEFSEALGGNRRREQFTIIIATFNRDTVLNASLERLHKLPYLNKVLVVWNNINRLNNFTWPRIHVPIIFLNATKNSLNNRFLPYREIETEAVLSLDDDMDLKQHEIIFAFRTWRENRDRIVGFPARYHAKYGDSMFYNSNHTCQLSMILTGAAFFHKSYLYTYTYFMPEIIRRKVDQWMNCEDLAMNFLVSHLTRQPPIKTTSKWTLKCPTCPETLSDDASHFNERHNCVRFFTQVYGYNPLLFTQFRADSVLFKTRVPPNHQKCFRYV